MLVRLGAKLSMAAVFKSMLRVTITIVAATRRSEGHILVQSVAATLKLALAMAIHLVRVLVTTRWTSRSIRLHLLINKLILNLRLSFYISILIQS